MAEIRKRRYVFAPPFTAWRAQGTHVIYPGKDGPWSSVRFEAHREGFEDYELLKRLKAKRPKAAAKIIAQAIRDYTKDTRTFRQARKALLTALDE
jgi:hypothetical protein